MEDAWKKIPYIGGPVASMAIEGDSAVAKATLIKNKVPPKSQLISYIIESINIDSYRFGSGDRDSKFFFMRDIGGFFPSPPGKAASSVVWWLRRYGCILGIPSRPCRYSRPTQELQVKDFDGKLGKMKETTVMSSEDFKDMTYGEYLGMITKSKKEKEDSKGLGVEGKEANSASASTEEFTKYVFGTWSARSIGLEFNADLGKSVLEILLRCC